MFALPLTASLPSTLASHLFGRFSAPSVPSPMSVVAMQSSGGAASARHSEVAEDLEDEEEFDLAQHVRNVGEW